MKYVLYWTWGQHRPVKTKKKGHHALKAWKFWYERKGWDVYGSQTKQMIAQDPVTGARHAICLRDAPTGFAPAVPGKPAATTLPASG